MKDKGVSATRDKDKVTETAREKTGHTDAKRGSSSLIGIHYSNRTVAWCAVTCRQSSHKEIMCE